MSDDTRELAIRTDERLISLREEMVRSARAQGQRIGALEAELGLVRKALGEGREFRAAVKAVLVVVGMAIGWAVKALT